MSIWGICLALAASGSPAVNRFIPAQQFTLAWTHSIEKTRWEEDYAVLAPTSPGAAPRLQARWARIKGSGAGMEPPATAVLDNGWYRYQPAPWPQTPLRLTRSEFTADFEVCIQGACQPMSHWLASDGGVTLLTPCAPTQDAHLLFDF